MARCPFASQVPISGAAGPYTAGPFRIVHHTTEGSTARGAFETYRQGRVDPHFTVDHEGIYQHIDTALAARTLRNDRSLPLETNLLSAVQIEVVGFAHLPKRTATLENIARLCRWIEQTHAVDLDWPSGLPKPAKGGRDPGGHQRDPHIWSANSGHYGHCHVPENIHWDPGYTEAEVRFIMSGPGGTALEALRAERRRASIIEPTQRQLRRARSTMPGH